RQRESEEIGETQLRRKRPDRRAGGKLMVTRRELLIGTAAAALASGARAAEHADKALKRIHQRVGGRLGVHVLDSQSGKRLAFDDKSRYAMASTFKLP